MKADKAIKEPPCGAAMHAPHIPIIAPDLLLLAYRSGVFPMSDARDDAEIFWVEPRFRAVLPITGFRCSRSLAKVLRSERFRVTVNRDFGAVIDACAQPRPDHPETWINHTIAASYRNLHRLGAAHSIEVWSGDQLAGGLYGVAFERVFCGESMFSRASNASKVALAWLVVMLDHGGYRLLDCQFMTGHLASLGAIEITREDYLAQLELACSKTPSMTLEDARDDIVRIAQETSSSPGKLIAQSLTQTS